MTKLMTNLRVKDPTRTATLRKKATSKINARYSRINRAISEYFRHNRDYITRDTTSQVTQFTFKTDSQKVQEFRQWLHALLQEQILNNDVPGAFRTRHWLNEYTALSYIRGANNVRKIAARRGIDITTAVLSHPAHVELAELIFSRVFTDLKGVTDTMEAQMSRVLSEGLLNGYGAEKIARNLRNRVDSIGKVRSRLIARTEIVKAYNVANVQEARNLESLTGDEYAMEWQTAEDERVRDRHRARDGKIYTKDAALAGLGEPNCRCSLAPYLPIFDEAKGLTPKKIHTTIV